MSSATPTPTAATRPTTTSSTTQPTPTPTVITPTTLPTPTPPPPPSGFILRVGTAADGTFVFLDEAGAPNPTLRVPPSTTITVDYQRGGQVHALSVGSETLAPAGSSDVRVTFESPTGGAFEYGCPVHPHQMRGTVQVQA